MKLYTTTSDSAAERRIAVDDMILTKDMPTAAGSKMLDGYMSLFEAEAVTKLNNAGYAIAGKTITGEFAIDLVGETSYYGACTEDGKLLSASAEAVKSGDVMAAVCMDVNGSVRRAAAQAGLVSVKPTYGTVSRYGTIPVACSGETVSVMADTTAKCRELLDVLAGHDDKDGTSLSEAQCAQIKTAADAKPAARVAVLTNFCEGVDDAVSAKIGEAKAALAAKGIEVCDAADETIAASRAAWNILMSAELCNNVSRYDGVKYGYRSQNFTNIDELYTNSRTEAFGELLKTAILFGSDTLSTENYMKVYDKAMRIRRKVSEAFAELFKQYDAVLIPACSKMAYTEADAAEKYMVYSENFYTAPASITGLPVVTAGSVQLIGSMFSENMLFETAKLIAKEGE